jgi:hypothetical protein
MLRWILVLFVLLAAPAARSDPHREPHRPAPVATSTPTVVLPTETAQPPDAPPATGVAPVADTATPTPFFQHCQICIEVSGTPQWPNACTATWWWGGSCSPTETHTPNPYP